MITTKWVKRCPSWGSSIMSHVPNKPNEAATCPGSRPTSLVASCPSWSTSIYQGLIPISHNLCQKRPDEGVLLLSVRGLIISPVLHLPSQRPSDGLFSPMEVRTNHLPMCTDPLVPVRRAWSCTSKATPSRGSLVQNIMAMWIKFHH